MLQNCYRMVKNSLHQGFFIYFVKRYRISCLHILVHAVIKPMLFTAAGGLIAVSGHKKEIQALRGAFYRNRWAGVGLIAGACSMIGIPLFAGFASKLNLAMASF